MTTLQTKRLTNASSGTANAWHFYYALVFVVPVLCGTLVVALSSPSAGVSPFLGTKQTCIST
ncbi:DUF3265 domain-containing protein, partial [Vibrio cholerae]